MCENICKFLNDRLEAATSGSLSECERLVFAFICDKENFKKISSIIYSAIKKENLTLPQSYERWELDENEFSILTISKEFDQEIRKNFSNETISPTSLKEFEEMMKILTDKFPNEEINSSFLKITLDKYEEALKRYQELEPKTQLITEYQKQIEELKQQLENKQVNNDKVLPTEKNFKQKLKNLNLK
jgi:hypothetical protein